MHSIPQDGDVRAISVQPVSLKEDVFASALSTTASVLSIFDIRRSTTGRFNAVIYYFKRCVNFSNRVVFCFIVI